eukprot:gnl/TRDRNA2_/TRDRNA2_202343_c0_seq1.p1 gnl/TRDRNA2_/TRDRNA2_202343_c0~~gnl/TRDRNA2_/TRDRNA2_202343_c0_seq1.p1  ORF type:complete len:606 (+),score=116.86 gnl/TRDRNA2_/TRDRNA2_202343_c0_seq1:183-1820(+)
MIFDECQDLSPCQHAAFCSPRARGSAVAYHLGDCRQRLYAWRFVKDNFEKMEVGKEFSLTQSFRFGKKIAKFATLVLQHTGHEFIDGVAADPGAILELAREDAYTSEQAHKVKVIIARSNKGMVDELVKIMEKRAGRLPRWSFIGEQHKAGGKGRSLVASPGDLRKLLALYRQHLEECQRSGIDPNLVEDSDDEEDHQSTELCLQDIAGSSMLDAEEMFSQLVQPPAAESAHLSSEPSTTATTEQRDMQEDSGDRSGQGRDKPWFSTAGDVFYSWAELKRFLSDSEDPVLQQKVDLVETYGDRLENIVSKLQTAKVDCSSSRDDWKTAEFALITGHAVKGMEFDEDVILANDFKPAVSKHGELLCGDKLPTFMVEESNIIYVAATRAKRRLLLSEKLWEYFQKLKEASGHQEDDGEDSGDDGEPTSYMYDFCGEHGSCQGDELKQLREKHEHEWHHFEEKVLRSSSPITFAAVPFPGGGDDRNLLCLHCDMGREDVKKEAFKALKRFHPDKMWTRLKADGRIEESDWAMIRAKLTAIVEQATAIL